MWHLEVRKVGGKFLALVTHHQIRSATFGLGPQVAESTDGINFVATGKHFLGWAGRTTSSEVYKASMVIHRDFSVGKVWQMTSSGVDKLRVSQIKTNAPESLQSDWIDTAITAAIAAEAPYFIGDRFDRADATLKDTLAESGQQWLQGSGSNHPVISNKAVMRGAADPSYAAINIGQSNMTVGFRVNQPSRTEQWELEAKSNRSISASRISLYWNASILTLRSVTSVAGVVNHGACLWPVTGPPSGPHDDADVVIDARGDRVQAWVNGKRIFDVTLAANIAAELDNYTRASFYLGGATTKITRFAVSK
jgi:hypothetical protein